MRRDIEKEIFDSNRKSERSGCYSAVRDPPRASRGRLAGLGLNWPVCVSVLEEEQTDDSNADFRSIACSVVSPILILTGVAENPNFLRPDHPDFGSRGIATVERSPLPAI